MTDQTQALVKRQPPRRTERIAGRPFKVPISDSHPLRIELERYRALMADSDVEFRRSQNVHRVRAADLWVDKPWVPDWVKARAAERLLPEDDYKHWSSGMARDLEETQALVPSRVSKQLARKLSRLGIQPEAAIQLARDYGTSPGHIAGWMGRLSLQAEEVEYLLICRSDFDVDSGVSFAELHRLWVWCGNEAGQFRETSVEREDVGNRLFENLLEFAADAVGGVTHWVVWALNRKIEYEYDGSPERLLEELNLSGWREIFRQEQDELTIARRNLKDMGIDWEAEDWEVHDDS